MSEMRSFEVYRLRSKISGKSYIGFTQRGAEKRWFEHQCEARKKRSRQQLLYSAIRKYGADGFEFEVLYEASLREEAAKKEAFFIRELGTLVPLGYNMTSGGESGFKMSVEALEKLRQSTLGHPVSEETKAKLRAAASRTLLKPNQKLRILNLIRWGYDLPGAVDLPRKYNRPSLY